MIFQYASDLHLEFSENRNYLSLHPLQPVGDVMLLAGDIMPLAYLDEHTDFLNYLSDHFKTTYWLPGNHEYYYSEMSQRSGVLNEKLRSNVFLVNNIAIQLENTDLIFSTLWSKISSKHEKRLEEAMNDFRHISYHQHLLKPQHINEFNQESVAFLQQELATNNQHKKVVITHHVPSFINAPDTYQGSILHEAMGVELAEMIETIGPDYWIYGHIHRNNPDFKIGKTILITNQMGYAMKNEHRLFKPDKTFICQK